MGGVSASGLQYITAPLSIGYGEPVPLWVAVAGNSGYGYPSGQISLLVDGSPADVYGSDFQTPSSLTLNYRRKIDRLRDVKSPSGQSSVLPNLRSGLAVGTHQLQAAFPGDNRLRAARRLQHQRHQDGFTHLRRLSDRHGGAECSRKRGRTNRSRQQRMRPLRRQRHYYRLHQRYARHSGNRTG